jgi:hypothetical protein
VNTISTDRIIDAFLLVVELREKLVAARSELNVKACFDKVTSNLMIYRSASNAGKTVASVDGGLNVYLGVDGGDGFACLSISLYPVDEQWCLDMQIIDSDDEVLVNMDSFYVDDLLACRDSIIGHVEKGIEDFGTFACKMSEQARGGGVIH